MSEVTLEKHLLGYAVRGIHEELKDRLAHISKYELKGDLLILCQDYIEIYKAVHAAARARRSDGTSTK